MAVAEALEDWLDDLGAIGAAANDLRAILEGLENTSSSLGDAFSSLTAPMRSARKVVADVAPALLDIAPAAREVVGPVDEVASAVDKLQERAHKLEVLKQAQERINALKPPLDALTPPVDEVAAAVEKLQDVAHKLDVLKQAKAHLDAMKPPIDEVAVAMEKLQRRAHEEEIFKQARANLGMIEAAATPASKALESLTGSAGGLADELMPTSWALGAVSKALQALGPAGIAVAVVLTAVTAVVTGLVIELWNVSRAAVGISQEKDQLAATFEALSTGTETGRELVDTLSEVAAKLPQAEGKALAWGKALMAAGKQGEALERSVRAVASAEALMGEVGASAAEGLIKRFEMMATTGQKVQLDRRILAQLAEVGVSAKTLGDAIGVPATKLGSMSIAADKLGDAMERALITKGVGALENMSLTWGSILGKLDDAWGDLFEDLGEYVRPLMKEIRDLFSEFSAGTTLQSAAKGAVMSFFATLFSWATRATHAIHVGFLEIQIGALKAYIYMAPLISTLKKIATNSVFLTGVKTVLGGIALVFAAVVGSVALTGAYFALMGAIVGGVVIGIGAGINYLYYLVVGTLVDMAGKAWTVLVGWATDAQGAATNFVMGIVDGIAGGVGKVVDAVSGLASKAAGAFTSFFQIKSPSKLMQAHGRQLPAGAAEGVDDGAVELEQAIDGMWEMPKPRRRAGAQEASASGGRPIEFNNCTFFGTTKEQIRELMLLVIAQEEAAGPAPA